ncbi:hypothetical protein [Streptomyces sp. NPDC048565]|uniref:hypothetical protein n=1 Tax=Streptomyces sp. NPDC048565 TaxID=3155266 RepID=UPI003447E708
MQSVDEVHTVGLFVEDEVDGVTPETLTTLEREQERMTARIGVLTATATRSPTTSPSCGAQRLTW